MDTRLALFTIGQGKAIPVDHAGPASYDATNGDVIGQANNQTGMTVQGLAVLDGVLGGGLSISGNYWAQVQPLGKGEQKEFTLRWFAVTYPSGVLTLTQVAGSTNLSAETVKLVYVGR